MSLKTQQSFFSKVRIARELLKEKAEEILTEYMEGVKKAQDAGNHDAALKALQWLMEHMPADEGERVVDVSVDKKQESSQRGPEGPKIQIGIAVGGLGQRSLPNPEKPRELPTVEVLDGN
jgi:hypothetical protein